MLIEYKHIIQITWLILITVNLVSVLRFLIAWKKQEPHICKLIY